MDSFWRLQNSKITDRYHLHRPLPFTTPYQRYLIHSRIFVDNLLTNNEANYESTLHCAQDTAGSPSLSKVTMGDITTFLAKSGHHQVIC